MRNPLRITQILNEVYRIWMATPDLRFWQVIELIALAGGSPVNSVENFYQEDDYTYGKLKQIANFQNVGRNRKRSKKI